MKHEIALVVDGHEHRLELDTRTTLLDLLREQLGVTSPKKGCDHGQCGACTVLVDGRRVTSCLSLAVANDGAEVTTAAGLPDGEALHPMQQAFVEHDGFQCGYCTPGQICSAIGMLDEVAAGWPSQVTGDLTGEAELTRRGDPRTDERQPLPLRRLREHRLRDPRGGVMREFAYELARDPEGAVAAVATDPEAAFLGGGTNLVDHLKLGA